ncbi:hypothetical protein Tco_0170564 [Tanacetum coccineum]
MRWVTRSHYLNEVVPRHWLHHSGQNSCSIDNNPPQTFFAFEPLVHARQLAAATIVAACVGVRQWLAATVAAANWWVAKPGGFIPTGCCLYHFQCTLLCYYV